MIKLNLPINVKKVDIFQGNDTLKRGDIKLVKVWSWRYFKHIIFIVYKKNGKLRVQTIDDLSRRKIKNQ